MSYFVSEWCEVRAVNNQVGSMQNYGYCDGGSDLYGNTILDSWSGECFYLKQRCIKLPACSCETHVPCSCETYVPCSCETHIPCSCETHRIPTCSCDTEINFSIGEFIEAKDYNYLLNKVNEARTTHYIGSMSLPKTTVSQRVNASFINSLIDGLIEANNAVGDSTISLSSLNKAIAQETIVTAEQLKRIVNKAHEIKVHCHCDSKCSCEDYIPPCSCENYTPPLCTCFSESLCACVSKSSCSCDSKSSCSCDINCSSVSVGCGSVSQSCSSLSCGSMGCSSEHSCTCDNKSSSSSSSCSCTGYTCSCNNYSCSCTSKKYK